MLYFIFLCAILGTDHLIFEGGVGRITKKISGKQFEL
jgi:hypothetical protein